MYYIGVETMETFVTEMLSVPVWYNATTARRAATTTMATTAAAISLARDFCGGAGGGIA